MLECVLRSLCLICSSRRPSLGVSETMTKKLRLSSAGNLILGTSECVCKRPARVKQPRHFCDLRSPAVVKRSITFLIFMTRNSLIYNDVAKV